MQDKVPRPPIRNTPPRNAKKSRRNSENLETQVASQAESASDPPVPLANNVVTHTAPSRSPSPLPAPTQTPLPNPTYQPPPPEFDDHEASSREEADPEEEDVVEDVVANGDSDPDEDEERLNPTNAPSIRCRAARNKSGDEGGDKRKVRGVVNGAKLAAYKHAHTKGLPIKVEMRADGEGLVDEELNSMMIHEIGSAVREKVPMLASSFRKLEEKDRLAVIDHLTPNFLIGPKDDPLWNWIYKKATSRYRNWKAECKVIFMEHGPDVVPQEFLDRPDQWRWLVNHFNEPKNSVEGTYFYLL